MLDNVRPQPRLELLDAWKKLMQSKINTKMPFNSTQALQCRRLLEYLADPENAEENEKDRKLGAVHLAMARQVLLEIDPIERTQHHLDLAKSLHSVWAAGNFPSRKPNPVVSQWAYLVNALSLYGGSLEAAQMM